MLNHMSLGKKIAAGFGLILLLTAIAGGVSLWNMSGAKQQTTTLVKEYLPEVVVLNQLETRALKTMLEVRGYAYSYKNTFLEAGRRSLAEAKKTLQRPRIWPRPRPTC